MKQEKALKQEIEQIEYIADHGIPIDVTGIVETLRPPHPFHYLAGLCFKMQGEMYTQLGQFQSAARANQAVVACRDAILGQDYNNRHTAFACERLGDSLERVDLGAAEKEYQRTVRTLQITDAFDRPYSQVAISKLLSIQRRLNKRNGKQGCCSLCGATSNRKCTRCGEVFYCSREHQKKHWSTIHKKQCKPKV
eukprot:scaffold80607_cov27-Attheya_sp.AAC.2